MSNNSKINKNVVPENFTIGLSLVDLIPVLLFGCSFIIIGKRIESILFIVGAGICLVSGFVKVLWKIIVCIKQKNVWPLFMQMRIAMPIGFLIILLSFFMNLKNINMPLLFQRIISFPSCIFFVLGIFGMILMSIFAFKLDSSDSKSNWIEQITNSIAQAFILLGIIFS